jgi:hypothetical protein
MKTVQELMKEHMALERDSRYSMELSLRDNKVIENIEVSFPMPTDDGGTYWESETCSHTEYSIEEYKEMLRSNYDIK